jgi:hypothetical protein
MIQPKFQIFVLTVFLKVRFNSLLLGNENFKNRKIKTDKIWLIHNCRTKMHFV